MLIAGGADVVFVAAQLGDSNPAVTLSMYSHLLDAREHAAQIADILEHGHAGTLERRDEPEAADCPS